MDTKLKTANIPCYFVKSSRKTGEKPSGENTAGRENPLLTGNIRNQLIRLAVPLLLGNILQQCYHIVDSLMIGRFVGLEAFAAIGVAGTVMNLLIFVMEGFCTGLSVVFSMYYGSGNLKKFREEVFVAIGFGSVAAVLLSVVFLAVLRPILVLMRTPENLLPYVIDYLWIIAAGLITAYFYNLFSAVLRAVGNTKAALCCLFAATVMNVCLDYVFVAEAGMGIAGAAWATVIAQAAAAAGCFLFLYRVHGELICTRKDLGFHRELLGKTVRFGFSSALQNSSLYIGKMLVQGSVNLLGTPGIAAFTAASRLEGFANSFGDSGAMAMSVMISQNYGAGKSERVKESLRQGMLLHIILGIGIPAVMFVLAGQGLELFLKREQAEAFGEGLAYLRLISVFYILCFVGSALVGFFRGIGKVHIPVIGTTLNIGTRVILARLVICRFGLAGLAAATGVSWMAVVGFQIWNLFKMRKKGPLCFAEEFQWKKDCEKGGNIVE